MIILKMEYHILQNQFFPKLLQNTVLISFMQRHRMISFIVKILKIPLKEQSFSSKGFKLLQTKKLCEILFIYMFSKIAKNVCIDVQNWF